MTTLRKRRLLFWLGLLAACVLLFVIVPWKAAPALLFLLLVFFSPFLEQLYKHIVRRPASSSKYQLPQDQEEEYSSYEEGYQPSEVPYYTPPSVVLKEEPVTEDVPMAQYQYPEMRQF